MNMQASAPAGHPVLDILTGVGAAVAGVQDAAVYGLVDAD